MIFYTSGEILLSILSALVYGSVFAIALVAIGVIKDKIFRIFDLPRQIFIYSGKIFSEPKFIASGSANGIRRFAGEALAGIATLLFCIGFILLSYYSLDGGIRAYMLMMSLLSFFAVRWALSATVIRLVDYLIDKLLCIAIYFLRILTYPFLRIYLYFYKKILQKFGNLSPNLQDIPVNSLDKDAM